MARMGWAREPVQARSQETLARLLDATEELLDAHPFDAITVNDICKAARSSVGAFYTRFTDKLSLLHVLHEHVCLEFRHGADRALAPEAWQERPLDDVIAAASEPCA